MCCCSRTNSAAYRAPAILPPNPRMLPQAMFTQHACDRRVAPALEMTWLRSALSGLPQGEVAAGLNGQVPRVGSWAPRRSHHTCYPVPRSEVGACSRGCIHGVGHERPALPPCVVSCRSADVLLAAEAARPRTVADERRSSTTSDGSANWAARRSCGSPVTTRNSSTAREAHWGRRVGKRSGRRPWITTPSSDAMVRPTRGRFHEPMGYLPWRTGRRPVR